MKFMIMMNAPRGNGDWGVMSWPAKDLLAHIDYMKTVNHGLVQAGELVTAEGLELRTGGILADVSPTALDLLGIEQPAGMTGKTLVE